MTINRQLYLLQEFDLVLDSLQDEKAKAEEELGVGLTIERLELEFQEEKDRALQLQSQHKSQQSDAEELQERSTRLDTQLYGGEVTNPRDLEALEQEATNAREILEQQNTDLLKLSVQAEESHSKCDTLETELSELRAAWQVRQAELQNQLDRCTKEEETVSTQRKDLVATLDPSEVQRYESLRLAKGGVAVAKVERGLCQACRMSLPTQQQQRVRIGRQTVLCSSCGRMLILS